MLFRKNQLVYLVLVLGIVACQNADGIEETDLEPQQVSPIPDLITGVADLKEPVHTDTLFLRELFEDSTRIGIRGRNKITVFMYDYLDTTQLGVNFYSKLGGKWILRNNYRLETGLIRGIQPVLDDFNGDGRLDFHCWDHEAARGANNVRKLFVYSKSGDSLIRIRNSRAYPNMVYNKRLNCIDALLYTSCSAQAFGRIQGDSIVDFAYLECGDNETRIYSVENGYPTLIRTDSSELSHCYSRFVNYSPLRLYEGDPSDYLFEKTSIIPIGSRVVPFHLWRKRLELPGRKN